LQIVATMQANSPKLTPQQQKEARQKRAEGATLKELAQTYNVRRATASVDDDGLRDAPSLGR
jgi:uncharacterized transporter YbjL